MLNCQFVYILQQNCSKIAHISGFVVIIEGIND